MHDAARLTCHGRAFQKVLWTVVLFLLMAGTAGPGIALAEPEFSVIRQEIVDGVEQAYVSYPSGDLKVTGWLFVNPFSEHGAEPCLVFNHGGVGGVSESSRAKCRWLAKQGFFVFAPSYRGEDDSEGEVEVAAGEVDDVLAAIQLLRGHPGILDDRFVLLGTSHGALISFKLLARADAQDLVFAGVIAYGVMDIYRWYQHLLDNDFDVSDPLSRKVYGNGPQDRPEAFALRHGISLVDQLGPAPVFLVQGAQDEIVPVEQAQLMYAALDASGRSQDRLKVYDPAGHGFLFWDDPELHSKEELGTAERAWRDILEFIRSSLKSGGQ